MIYAFLLLASASWGQEASTSTAIPLLDDVKISNLGKDTRNLLSGRYTQTGKPTFRGGICFADATCQTTAAISTAAVSVSSRSADLQGITFTATAYGVARASQTLTLSGNNPAMVCFSGGVNCQDTNASFGWNFLYDGAYISPLSSSVGVSWGHGYSGSGFVSPTDSGCYMVPAASLSAGSHTFALTALCTTGVLTFGQNNGTVKTAVHFFVYELH